MAYSTTSEGETTALTTRRIGPYEVVEALGRGGFGEVVLALAPGGALCVVKTSHAESAPDTIAERRFLEEARTLAVLHHPNISRLLDVGYDQGRLYIALEFVPGVELAWLLARRGRGIPANLAVSITADVARALAWAHAALSPVTKQPLRLVHRDVSTKNVLVTFDGDVKLIDFGIATSVEHPRLTTTEGVLGTVGYIAPERLLDDVVDARADVYAAGVVCYELVVGRRFFSGKERPVIMRLLESRAYVPPLDDVPEGLRPVLVRATHGDVNQRTPSAQAFLDELTALDATLRPDSSTPLALARLMRESLPDDHRKAVERQKNLAGRVTAVHLAIGLIGSRDSRDSDPTLVREAPRGETTRVSLQPVTEVEPSVDDQRLPTFVGGQSISGFGDDAELSITDPPLTLPPEISKLSPIAPPPPPPMLLVEPDRAAMPLASPPPLPPPTTTGLDARPLPPPPISMPPTELDLPSSQLPPLTAAASFQPSLRGRLFAGVAGGVVAVACVIAALAWSASDDDEDNADAGVAAVEVADASVFVGADPSDASDANDNDVDVDAGSSVGADAGPAVDDGNDNDTDTDDDTKTPKKNPPKKKKRPPPAPLDGTVGDLVGYLRSYCLARVSCARPLVAKEKTLTTPADLRAFADKAVACASRCERER